MKHLSSREPSRWAYCLWRCDQHSKLISSIATDLFGPPNPYPHRRVVVTGIGLVTPLGVGKRRVWERLIAGDTAIRALVPDDLPEVLAAFIRLYIPMKPSTPSIYDLFSHLFFSHQSIHSLHADASACFRSAPFQSDRLCPQNRAPSGPMGMQRRPTANTTLCSLCAHRCRRGIMHIFI